MDFYEMLDQVLQLLRERGRVSYRALKRQFGLDDEALEDLKEAILFDHPEVQDQDGKGLILAVRSGTNQGAVPPAAPLPPRVQILDSSTYTPPHLAEKILRSRAALQGERKQVTVLFCDLANSTGMAEQLGAETMHDFLNQFFKHALNAVHHYEGNVNQFLGDGFMALFGAPIAHEDHARRAVLAALELRRRIDTWNRADERQQDSPFTLRMGLNTGVVVVGAIGDNLRMDYTAVGDTTNVAARLEAQAAPDQIVISETTHRLVEGYCRMRPLGTLVLKGKTNPVPTWELLAASDAVTRLDVELERGLTNFVGREPELQTLQGYFEQARSGQGRVVLMAGDPGIGKSRLLLELRRQVDATDAVWLEGHALSFERSTALYPLIDMLRRRFGIEEADAEATIVAKIEQARVWHGEALRADLPYLRYLLGADPGDENVRRMDPQLRRGELFQALRRFLLYAPKARPTVAVIEDIEWMDGATQEFLEVIDDSVETSHLLFVLTYRPGHVPQLPDRSWHVRLTLRPLETTHGAQVARTLLGVDHLPDNLASLLARKTEGNPFFVEQVIRSLQEAGTIRRVEDRCVVTGHVEDDIVPGTVLDVVAARIDRLAENQKTTLQLASVVGREFTPRLLARVEADRSDGLDTRLRELVAIELIQQQSLEPETYSFRNALTRDVAYNSLLTGTRQDLHRLIGEAIEEFEAHRLVEHSEALAHHFERAEVWDKALTYLAQAGQKAQQASALTEALDFHERALAVCERLGTGVDPAMPMSINTHIAEVHFLRSEFPLSVEAWQRVRDIAIRSGDRETEARALYKMGLGHHWSHEFERALECSERARTLALEIGSNSTVAASTFVTGWVHAVLGELEEATRRCSDAMRMSRDAGDQEQEGFCLFVLGQIQNWKAEYPDALRLLDQALGLGRTGNLPFLVAGVLWMGGIVRCGMGKYETALASLREALELSERPGDRAHQGRILNTLGWVCSELHDFEAALGHNQASIESAVEIGDPEIIRNASLNQGDTLLALGRLDEAEAHFEKVHESLQQRGTWGEDWMKWRYAEHLWHGLGELWLVRGDGEMALIYAKSCCEGAGKTGSRKNLAKGWRLQGQALLAQGHADEAEHALCQGLKICRDLGNPPQLWRTLQALGALHEEQDERGRAHAAYRDALDVIERMASPLQDSERRRIFLDAPLVRRIREGAARTTPA